VDNTADVVDEGESGGNDRIDTTVDFQLPYGVEALAAVGAYKQGITLRGNGGEGARGRAAVCVCV